MAGFKTIADIKALEEKAFEDYDLPTSTYELIKTGAEINPSRIALSFFLEAANYSKPKEYSYQEMISLINQVANMFNDFAIDKDSVVSLVLPNLPQTFFSIFAAETAGIVNPINPLLEAEQIADIMNAAKTKVLVTLAPFPKTDIWPKLSSIIDRVASLETVFQIDLAQFLPFVKRIAVGFMKKYSGTSINKKVLDFDKTLKKYSSTSLDFKRDIKASDIASYFHTGGTTGTPKLAQHSHLNEIANTWMGSQTLPLSPKTNMFCGLPLFHVNAVVVTGTIPFSQGAHVVLASPAGYRGKGVMQNFWKIVEHYKINYFSGVPTVYSGLLNIPIDADISSLQYAICGAAPMPEEVFKSFEEYTNINILEGYGMTEGACISSVNPAYGDRRVGSIGYSLPHQEMKTVCLDEAGKYLHDCAIDEIGIVVIRGPNVFPGYKDERANQDIWLKIDDGKAWFNTGDMARMDADGYFWLTGRRKELIIRGGHNIDPKLIEAPLHSHPAVALAAAIGRPDAYAGEVPVAYVELLEGRHISEQELLDFAKANIGERAAVPKAIKIIDAMPVTAVGKIFKPTLVYKEVKDVYKNVLANIEGIEAAKAEVGPNKLLGTLARLSIKLKNTADIEFVKEQIKQELGKYTVKYKIEEIE